MVWKVKILKTTAANLNLRYNSLDMRFEKLRVLCQFVTEHLDDNIAEKLSRLVRSKILFAMARI